MTGPWTRSETSASGQVFEFRLWAALTEQSRGLLHVFLPLADRGVDALAHRLADGVYLPVQAKSRSTLTDGEVHLVILAESLANDDLLIVAGLLVDGGLGPTALVVTARDFKILADKSTDQGTPIYSMEFGMRPRSDSRWLPWLIPSERLVERFGVSAVTVEEEVVKPRPVWRSDVGFLGEAEVTRRLAEAGETLFSNCLRTAGAIPISASNFWVSETCSRTARRSCPSRKIRSSISTRSDKDRLLTVGVG